MRRIQPRKRDQPLGIASRFPLLRLARLPGTCYFVGENLRSRHTSRMIAPRTQNESSSHIFPDACLGRVSLLLIYSSFSVMGPRTLIRILVRGAIHRSPRVMGFGSLSQRSKGGPDGAYPYQRSCQRLPNLAEKN